ncbi:Ribosome biogenesis ATPase rix7 [Cladophialophora chaetospira]|uniref:Ribosome biogenesis ATPase rix7 n=1 Tax=Cladophialophora chaetospira TaxID=386627 RepID=A0AA38X4U5_9EURO|nr:Ribosome biogenesis ATPase rix7 [Cladophialophora chaetospira]
MARGGRRRQTLGQGLDREVYQVVRKIIDERAQYEDARDNRVSFATVYDEIRASNSSLNRRPKKLLEDSIERVLETLQQDNESDSEEPIEIAQEERQRHKKTSNNLNRSIVGAWANLAPAGAMDSTAKIAAPVANGEPPKKKRKGITVGQPVVDRSPPTHITWDSLGGIDPVIQQFEDLVVIPMTKPEVYAEHKVQPPRGILIHGPAGCGKTMVAHALAAELGVNFINISAPSIVSGMSGESEKALREHFEEAMRCAPCLIFIDEIDAITPKRESAQREMEKRIVAQLLICMDDLALEKTDGKPVIVLAATNRPDSLDPALRRGGRFDKEINMSVPSEPVREQILRAQTREMSLASDVDFALLAKRTPGFVGADLNDLVSTASATAVRRYLNQLKANAEKHTMDVDMELTAANGTNTNSAMDNGTGALLRPTSSSATVTSFRHLVKYARSTHRDTNEATLLITSTDFLTALPQIQPSSLREGFATIPTTTFSAIGALTTHITELQETVIQPILNPSLYTALGITPSSGTLLWGPPGCGKTLLAKACANASHANFISVKGPELLNKYVGESERAVRQVFTRARSSVPVIIFFDELDALVPTRDGGSGGGSEASARVVNTLLTELDGVGQSREGIYVIAATNRPDIIDSAMLRPGRLDTLLYVGLPDAEGRVDILRTLCRKVTGMVFDESAAAIARACDGFSGADLESLVRRAGYSAIRRQSATIATADFQHASTEVRRSVGVDDMRRFEALQKHWGRR